MHSNYRFIIFLQYLKLKTKLQPSEHWNQTSLIRRHCGRMAEILPIAPFMLTHCFVKLVHVKLYFLAIPYILYILFFNMTFFLFFLLLSHFFSQPFYLFPYPCALIWFYVVESTSSVVTNEWIKYNNILLRIEILKTNDTELKM